VCARVGGGGIALDGAETTGGGDITVRACVLQPSILEGVNKAFARRSMLAQLIELIVSEMAFTVLRTQEQLGCVVLFEGVLQSVCCVRS
jgi:secreted Zn-dependent insulinase-like peptidase